MEIDQALKRAREHTDFTQTEVAKVLYTSQQQYSLYENGKRHLKSDQIIALSKLFQVSADYLLGLTDDPKGSWLQKK